MIGIRNGEVRQKVVDLVLNSSPRPLTFERSYRQARQNALTRLGLGWTHNHHIRLQVISGTPNQVRVVLAAGGEANFVEVSPQVYTPAPGVSADLLYEASSSTYRMVTSDAMTYVFNSAGQLVSQIWSTGDTWNYTYAGGDLIEVADDYGRKLKFRYYTSGHHANQLFRVGDQTFDDANPLALTGRYIEFAYIPNKIVSAGSVIDGSASLLNTVRDVRGQVWQYSYYDQLATGITSYH